MKFSAPLLACCLTTLMIGSHSITSSAQSQGNGPELLENSQAEDSLKSILDNFQSYQADFTQLIEDAEGQILQQSSGKILLKKPNKLRWEVMTPDESLFIADGSTVTNLDPFVEQATLLDQANLISNNPLTLLLSDASDAWDAVDVGRNKDTYTVLSQDDSANIVSLKMTFSDGILQQLISTDRQGQINAIDFINIQQNQEIQDESFRADIPESFAIDDQRRGN